MDAGHVALLIAAWLVVAVVCGIGAGQMIAYLSGSGNEGSGGDDDHIGSGG